MKKIFSLIMVLSMVIVVASCSKDDPNMPKEVNGSKAYEITFMIGAGQPTSNKVEMKLSDFTGLGTYTKNVYQANIIPQTTELTITGITAGGHELKDVKLALDGTKTVLQLGNLTADKTTTIKTDLDFLQSVANRMQANKSVSLTFSFSQTAKDINRTVPVKINMSIQFLLK